MSVLTAAGARHAHAAIALASLVAADPDALSDTTVEHRERMFAEALAEFRAASRALREVMVTP